MKKILHFQAAETAKQRGAAVIVITGHILSPLAKIADICLHGIGREANYSTEAGTSRMVHMDIGEVLYTRITMADSDGFRKNMECMWHETGKKRLT